MKQYGSLLLVLIFFLCLGRVGGAEHQSATPRGKNESVELTLFWQPGCPFCQRAKSFFENRPETSDWLTVSTIDLTESIEAQGKFQAVNRIFGI
jgi:thioredoxin-related protein